MRDTKFFQPCDIRGWCVVIFERQQRFNEGACKEMIQGLVKATREVGEYSETSMQHEYLYL